MDMKELKLKTKECVLNGELYWNNQSIFKDLLEKLRKTEFTKKSCKAKSVNGELLNILVSLTYEYRNNGNINVLDVERQKNKKKNDRRYKIIIVERYEQKFNYLVENCKCEELEKEVDKLKGLIKKFRYGNPEIRDFKVQYQYELIINMVLNQIMISMK